MLTRTITIGATLALVGTIGCARPLTTRERTTLGGAAIGAGSGALIGEAAGDNPAAGALIGGAIGTAGGALVGNEIERSRDRRYERDDY